MMIFFAFLVILHQMSLKTCNQLAFSKIRHLKILIFLIMLFYLIQICSGLFLAMTLNLRKDLIFMPIDICFFLCLEYPFWFILFLIFYLMKFEIFKSSDVFLEQSLDLFQANFRKTVLSIFKFINFFLLLLMMKINFIYLVLFRMDFLEHYSKVFMNFFMMFLG